MGYRTTLILFNDQASAWEKDGELGRKIAIAMNHATDKTPSSKADLGYGRVVECVHADQQTLAVLESYNMTPLAHSSWFRGQVEEQAQLELLRQAVEKLGYRLVKKSN